MISSEHLQQQPPHTRMASPAGHLLRRTMGRNGRHLSAFMQVTGPYSGSTACASAQISSHRLISSGCTRLRSLSVLTSADKQNIVRHDGAHFCMHTSACVHGEVVKFHLADIGEGIAQVAITEWYVQVR